MQASIGFITARHQTRITDNSPQETVSEFYFSEMWGREGPVLKTSFIGVLQERTLVHLKLETVAKQQPLFFYLPIMGVFVWPRACFLQIHLFIQLSSVAFCNKFHLTLI